MTQPELKSCPFCGGESERATVRINPNEEYPDGISQVRCKACLIITPMLRKSDAIAAWNTRALTPKQKAAEEMAKVLERFNQYYESDFIRVSADDGRTLAEQMHSMRVAVDAYNALAKAGHQ